MYDTSKALHKGKFIAVNTYFENFHLKELEKEQIKPKAGRRK